MEKVEVFIQCQFVTTASSPWSRKINRGNKLTANAVLTAVFTWVVAHWPFTGVGLIVVIRGYASMTKIRINDVVITRVVCIAPAWICTKSFWFLRPADDYYPS